jgi:hypothetical protein
MFSVNSRYLNIATAEYQSRAGKQYVYLRRRFLPAVENFDLLLEHVVTQGERVDNIAAEFLGDPELFWRLCDANGAMRPEELTETVGRRLRITLPEGIPGTPNA